MRKSNFTYPFLLCLFLTACQEKPANKENTEATTVIKADTVALQRANIKTEAVAEHHEKVQDEFNDWKFTVQLFETKATFRYSVRIRYKELRVTEEIELPNLAAMPQPQIEQDKEPLSCIIGFLDKKGSFKPYYRVAVKNDRLQFKKIAGYAVAVTSQPAK